MRYQYKFGTGYETIEVDEEWMAVLRELDRQERNNNIYESKMNVHYDAFEYEPSFMGTEDENLSLFDKDIAVLFDGTPAFEYAVSHLTPHHQEVLYRRAIQGETFVSIGKSYGSRASVAHSYYTRLCARFRKYYDEWYWLNSKENTALPGAGNVGIITTGLTPAQIMAIRTYRYQYKTMREIADLVGVSTYHVQECLHDNPILETKCPVCGSSVPQDAYSRMVIFCSHRCYLAWHRNNAFDMKSDVYAAHEKELLTEPQKQMINFYRQLYIPVPTIGKIVGVPRLTVQSFVHMFPLPYTHCQFCGTKIPARESRKLLKYCSDKCREHRDNKERTLKKHNKGHVRERIIPTPEHLEYAIELREAGFSFKQIRRLAGLTRKDTDELFRFKKAVELLCAYCKKTFITEDIQELYCSEKCQAKAKARRKKKRKKEKENAIS